MTKSRSEKVSVIEEWGPGGHRVLVPDDICTGRGHAHEGGGAFCLKDQTITHLTAQVLDLNQCVECGEMDHQDGIRIRGKFRCFGCFDRVAVLPEDG